MDNEIVALCGFFVAIALVLSCISIITHLKNYKKPVLQRSVVRILMMIVIYSSVSFLSVYNEKIGSIFEPFREIYEAFALYCFFCLLIDYLGGERAAVISLHGHLPRPRLWPLNYLQDDIDLSDPYTFLSIKRGILQYTWLKPFLVIAVLLTKVTGVYDREDQPVYASADLWIGLVYNISITLSLYSLTTFWVCLHEELAPFRPFPKFLSVKAIIFASYWQQTVLSIANWLGLLNGTGWIYSLLNQNVLMCLEMPFFALSHWYAFRIEDYDTPTWLSCARLPLLKAFKDVIGLKDVWCDSLQTLHGDRYVYQNFEPGENLIPSRNDGRINRTSHGLRYSQGGQSKYWISRYDQSRVRLINNSQNSPQSNKSYFSIPGMSTSHFENGLQFEIDDEMEPLYNQAKQMRYGDYNYPVLLVNNTHASSSYT
ncbi:Organic solute transporter Ostalpha-domain-containing protein [Schizosaccharomyces pombe]